MVGLLNANSNKIQISVDGSPFVTVTLPRTPGTTMVTGKKPLMTR
jgi:hypothetical protein